MESRRVTGVSQTERYRILAELYTWESMTGEKLPIYANKIVDIELAGGVVDLETGDVFYPKEANNDRIPELFQHQPLSNLPGELEAEVPAETTATI